MNYIDKITLDDLSEEQREVAEIVGLENYIKLVKYFGGSSIYIHKANTLSRNIRDIEIRDKFTGRNYKELSLQYNLSTNQIREIVDKESMSKFQISLF